MTNPNTLSFTKDDTIRIRQLIKEGVQVQAEIKMLREGLSETVKAIGEEIDVKPKVLNKAITIAFKDSLHDEKDQLDVIEHFIDIYRQSNP
jgi:hypothetical protein